MEDESLPNGVKECRAIVDLILGAQSSNHELIDQIYGLACHAIAFHQCLTEDQIIDQTINRSDMEDNEKIPLNFTPDATWTDDCQGKKDYDGDLIRISTRYWPSSEEQKALGSAAGNVFDGQTFFAHPYRGGLASAKAAITLVHKDAIFGSVDLISKKFEGATREEVQREVEVWVAEQSRRVLRLLIDGLPISRDRLIELPE